MAIMGLETPVEMPSMNVYNTDLMKMYIAGLKDQYEKGREDFKDFMKLYLDFYSPIDGDTEAYNNMTIGGAGDMINQMLANGVDPFKNPEARAAISKYIYTRPVGTLNAMKQNAENRRLYDQAVAKARAEGKFDPAYEQWALQQAGLDNFRTVDPNTGLVRVWDRLGPDATQTMGDIAVPYFEKFKQTEKLKSDQPGYIKYGVSDENQQKAIGAAMQHLEDTPWGKYLRYKADQQAAAMFPGATPEQLRAASDNILRELVSGIARQYFQPKYEVDEYAKAEHLARLTARYSRSSGGGGGGHGSQQLQGSYLAIYDAASTNIANLMNVGGAGLVRLSLRLGTIWKDGKLKDHQKLKQLSTNFDGALFSGFLGRTAVGGNKSVVSAVSGDQQRLYSATEIGFRAAGANGKSPTVYGSTTRNHMSSAFKSGGKVEMVSLNEITTVEEKDGLIHVYLPVRVKPVENVEENEYIREKQLRTSLMYYDTGYTFDPETGELTGDNTAAIQMDANTSRSLTGKHYPFSY